MQGHARILMAVLAVALAIAPGAAVAETSVEVVGHSNLGGGGMNGAVAVSGSTAFVAGGILASGGAHSGVRNPLLCPSTAPSVKIVDLSNPAAPSVVATIPIAGNQAAMDVDVADVSTLTFTGKLLAVALASNGCPGTAAHRGVEYWDVTTPASPAFLGRYLADMPLACNPVPVGGPSPVVPGCVAQIASSQHAVTLVERQDGIVLSLSTEPGATGASLLSGDLRIVDVTNPRLPREVGSYHPYAAPTEIFSNNGCRPFSVGHHATPSADGRRVFLAAYDKGVQSIDISDPSKPTLTGSFSYPDDVEVEGNANEVALAHVAGTPLGVVVEDDFVASRSTITWNEGGTMQTVRACQAVFTQFEPTGRAPVFKRPNGVLAGRAVFAGRACPSDALPDGIAGSIALIDRGGVDAGRVCRFDDKARKLEDAGAIAAIVRNTNTTGATAPFAPDGIPDRTAIPVWTVGTPEGRMLQETIERGSNVTLTLRDTADGWGGIRVLDLSDPASPVERGSYVAPPARGIPADAGIYAAADAHADGSNVWVAWHSAGVRLVDISDPSDPVEIASFKPTPVADPTGNYPALALAKGVALLETPTETLAVVTDINAGLYVLRHAAS